MIAGTQYDIVLAYPEITALEEYLFSAGTSLEITTSGASYSASAHGVIICFGSEKQRDKIVDFVLLATDDKPDDE